MNYFQDAFLWVQALFPTNAIASVAFFPMHEITKGGQSLTHVGQILRDAGVSSTAGLKTYMEDDVVWQSFVA